MPCLTQSVYVPSKPHTHASAQGFKGRELLAPLKGSQDLFSLCHREAPTVMMSPHKIKPINEPIMMPSNSFPSFMLQHSLNKVGRGSLDDPLRELANPMVSQAGLGADFRPLAPLTLNVVSSLFGQCHGGVVASSYQSRQVS